MEKIKILTITNSQLRDLVFDEYLTINNEDINVVLVDTSYDGSGRHTEYHTSIFHFKDTDQYFQASYETSVKDEMGWNECNWKDTYTLIEVEPYEVKTIEYRKCTK